MTRSGAPIVRGTGNFHDAIRKSGLGVAQYIFDNARTFHTRESMFNTDACARQALITKQLRLRQVMSSRLFLADKTALGRVYSPESLYPCPERPIWDSGWRSHRRFSYHGLCPLGLEKGRPPFCCAD